MALETAGPEYFEVAVNLIEGQGCYAVHISCWHLDYVQGERVNTMEADAYRNTYDGEWLDQFGCPVVDTDTSLLDAAVCAFEDIRTKMGV